MCKEVQFPHQIVAGSLSVALRGIRYLFIAISLFVISIIANSWAGVGMPVMASSNALLLSYPVRQSSSDPLVLAFYYTWFDEKSWTYNKLSDLPAQPYVSRDPSVMGRHIDEAKRGGIDTFLVAWYGPTGQFNQTESNLTALLQEAASRNFKIGILFETDSPFFRGTGDVVAALQHLSNVHATHPAYLRADGRPVVFFWRPTLYDVDTWRTIRGQADPSYNQIWISEGVDTGYLAVFEGHHLYSNTWNPPADLTHTNQKFARQIQDARQQLGGNKLWVATAMPGYNDVRIRNGGFIQDRQGGAYYERSWQAALNSQPNWVVITSFNEWPEGTYIEPSAAFGDHYLNLTAKWSQTFKAGRGITGVQPNSVPPPSPVTIPPLAAEPNGPTAYVNVSLLNVRAGPGLEHPILARFSHGTALPIIGRQAEWVEVALDTQTGWVYVPMVRLVGLTDNRLAQQEPCCVSSTPTVQTLPNSSESLSPTAKVNVTLLNLRNKPNTTASILARLPLGTPLSIIGKHPHLPEWWQVTSGILRGWVYAPMVDIVGSVEQVPLVIN